MPTTSPSLCVMVILTFTPNSYGFGPRPWRCTQPKVLAARRLVLVFGVLHEDAACRSEQVVYHDLAFLGQIAEFAGRLALNTPHAHAQSA